jgi:BMFP domain-containing protein YqiC
MPAHRPFEDLQARLADLLEASPAKDIGRNAKAFLSSTLSRLDLVSREEFDIQAKLLARTLEKLAALEARVAALEAGTPAGRMPAADPDSGAAGR